MPDTTRPILRNCRPCGVAWAPGDGLLCWLCGRASDDVRQMLLTSYYSISPAAKALEEELAKKPRDWDGDPCSWRQLPEETPLKLLARRFMGPRVLPAPDEQPDPRYEAAGQRQ